MKRILSMFIAVIMVISMLPAMVFTSAADATADKGEAYIGTTYYPTLLEAFAHAKKGNTIKLVRDCVIPYTGEYNADGTKKDVYKVVFPESCILDLRGFSLDLGYTMAIFQNEIATIKNGTIKSSEDCALCIGNGTTNEKRITLSNLTVVGGVKVFDASATFENCTVDASDRISSAVWGDEGANITIRSGIYKGGNGKPAIDDVSSSNPDIAEENRPQVSILTGTFSSDVTKYLDPNTAVGRNNDDGTFSVEAIRIEITHEGSTNWYPGEQMKLTAKLLPEDVNASIKSIEWTMDKYIGQGLESYPDRVNKYENNYFKVDQTGLVTCKEYTSTSSNRYVKATATLDNGVTITSVYKGLPKPSKFSAPTVTVTGGSVDTTTKPINLYPGDTVDVQVSWQALDYYGLTLDSPNVTVEYVPYITIFSTGFEVMEAIHAEPKDGGATLTALTSLTPNTLNPLDDESKKYLVVKVVVSIEINGVTVSGTQGATNINILNAIEGDYPNRAVLCVGESYQLKAPHLVALGTVTWSSENSAISVDESGVMTVHEACEKAIITASVTAEDGTTYKSYQAFNAIAGPAIATLEVNGKKGKVSDLQAVADAIHLNETAVITMISDFTYDYDLTFNIKNKITLNLGDYKISRKAPLEHMTEDTPDFCALTVKGGATLTINSGEKGSIVSSDGTKGYYTINVGKYSSKASANSVGTVTINGGYFFGCTSAVNVQCGTATINGGTFEIEESDTTYLLNCKDANYTIDKASITVNGGTFKGFDPQNNAAEGTGTNFVNPDTALNLTSMDNGDGSFTVMESATVTFNEFNFTVGETMSMDVTLTDPALDNTGKDCTVYLDVLTDGKWQNVGQEIKVPAEAAGEKYSFTFSGIPMVYLSNNMRARVISHDNEGKEHGKTLTQFGEEGAKEDISFAHYAKTLKASQSENKELCDLLNSMLNYITEAQSFKGYNTNAPANSELKDEEKQVTSIMNYTDADWSTYKANKRGMTSPAAYDVKFTGSQLLMLSDKTGFRFHFTAASTDGLEMIIKIGDTEVSVTEFTSVGDGEYTAEYAGVAPTAIDTQLKVVINKNGTRASNIVYDSIPATAKYIAGQEKYADQRALMSTMLDYGKKATAYENKTK